MRQFPKLRTAMKISFNVDIPDIHAPETQMLKNIQLDDMKEYMYKSIDRSKLCMELIRDYF